MTTATAALPRLSSSPLSTPGSEVYAGPLEVVAPPPECMKAEELTPEEKAKLAASTSRHSGIFNLLHHSRSKQSKVAESKAQKKSEELTQQENRLSHETDASEIPFVRLNGSEIYSSALEEDYDKDVYRWAVIYENQRGSTLFSTPYYSRLTLLPIDPPAFTIPSAAKTTRRHHPTVSLTSYPLPDGDWRWVSRTWMVDMRSDGQTQFDGFEYNWFFRQKHWRSQVGFFSSGGWVRRRRWVRLMLRPARTHSLNSSPSGTHTPAPHGVIEEVLRLEHHEAGATRPPSIFLAPIDDEDEGTPNIWQGKPDEDWTLCHRALTRLDRDGRKLELWQRWLRQADSGASGREKGKGKAAPQKQWSEDDAPLPSQHAKLTTSTVDGMLAADTGFAVDPAARQYIAPVLREHAAELLQMFVYPDSRTRFLEILADVGLLSELNSGLGLSENSALDFWSSSQSIQSLLATTSPSHRFAA